MKVKLSVSRCCCARPTTTGRPECATDIYKNAPIVLTGPAAAWDGGATTRPDGWYYRDTESVPIGSDGNFTFNVAPSGLAVVLQTFGTDTKSHLEWEGTLTTPNNSGFSGELNIAELNGVADFELFGIGTIRKTGVNTFSGTTGTIVFWNANVSPYPAESAVVRGTLDWVQLPGTQWQVRIRSYVDGGLVGDTTEVLGSFPCHGTGQFTSEQIGTVSTQSSVAGWTIATS